MPARPYVTVDVFTERAFAGNPLAVITDARGLGPEQMQAIAAEFGYSETTFVLPPEDPAHTARVRIFAPRREIPFAGHPNVGTAFVVARLAERSGRRLESTLLFEEGAGLGPVDVLRDGAGGVTGAVLTAPQPLTLGRTVPAGVVAECVGLAPGAVLTGRHEPVVASVGLPFMVAEVAIDPIGAARPNLAAFTAAVRHHPSDTGWFSLFLYPGGAPGRRCRPAGQHVLAARRHHGGSGHRQRQRRADRTADAPGAGSRRAPRPRGAAGRGDGPAEPSLGQRREARRRDRARAGRRALRAGDGGDAGGLGVPSAPP